MENDIIETIKTTKTEFKISSTPFSLLDKSTYTYLTSNKEIEMDFMFNVSPFLKKNEVGIIQSKESCKRTFSKDEYLPIKVLPEHIGDDNIENLFISYYTRRLEEITESFIPTLYNSILYNIPEEGESYYNSLGLLRNTFINTERLQKVEFDLVNKGSIYSPLRNHYRSSIYPSMGFTPEDIAFCTTYLKEYPRNEEFRIVAVASPSSFESIKKITPNDGWSSSLNIQDTDIYKATEGVIPEGYVIFIVTHKGDLLKNNFNESTLLKVESLDPNKRGVSLRYPDKDIEELEEEDFKHPTIDIGSIGYYLIGREKMLILDTNSRKNNPDYNLLDTLDNGRWFCSVMTSEGLEELQEFADNCNPKFVQ